MGKDSIEVINARENNLKGISVEIPKGIMCGICGVSGSGKSTFACDVVAKYALENFALSVSPYIRKKLNIDDFVKVDEVKNLPPVILIDIKNANKSSRSTVATVSGLMNVLRGLYSRFSMSENDDEKKYPRLFSYNISENEGGGACTSCSGTGLANSIKLEQIISDTNKGIFDGGFSVINAKGIKYTKISDLFIKAFCKEFSIDTATKVSDLTENELKLLLYGSDRIINFTDRTGANNGKKSLTFPGIVGALSDVYSRTKNANIEKLISLCSCPQCNGTRYNKKALSYTMADKTIADFLALSISDAAKEIGSISSENNHELNGYVQEFLDIAEELERIGVGYLELKRGISSISGGELQRIKLAKQISMKMEGYCYVIDEPSSGLHSKNVASLIKSLKKLCERNNTILIVEHNPEILWNCDCLLELGPMGGVDGGEIIAVETPQKLVNKGTLTGQMLSRKTYSFDNNIGINSKKIILKKIQVNNLKNVDLEIPMHSFVTIAGVSGSGKSSAINVALYSAVNEYLEKKINNANLIVDDKLYRIVTLNQNASVANSRSTVGTLLGVMDKIKELFAAEKISKDNSLLPVDFGRNSGKGVCVFCKGVGYCKDEDDTEEECPQCNGSGYNDNILKIKYCGYNISQIMDLNIDELFEIISDVELRKVLNACKEVGLGYLSLGRKSPSLSKGEYQRIRIASELCKISEKSTLFILDEPSKGLHNNDVQNIIWALKKLVLQGHSVIAIEHNLDVIAQSDYVIEFGPDAGKDGGEIVFEGLPCNLLKSETYTGKALNSSWFEVGDGEREFKNDTSYIINLIDRKININIKKDKINIIRGNIASGKTELVRKLLYANPLKRYITCISTQGKYLTREIDAISSGETILPLARVIDCDYKFYSTNEKVCETLNLNKYIVELFSNHARGNEHISRNTFNTSKKAGKCLACLGAGRMMSYDFERVFGSKLLESDLRKLLKERTRITRIQPLLKSKYGIDISKSYKDMNNEEKRVFIFGGKDKEVYYEEKLKNYTWDGCNSIVKSNMTYASEMLQNELKKSYQLRECPHCGGFGIMKDISSVLYKSIYYEDFMQNDISKIFDILSKSAPLCYSEEKLLICFEMMIKFGLGHIALSSYTGDCSTKECSVLQYLAFRFNPLSGSMIVWDDFTAYKNESEIKLLVDDLKKLSSQGTTVVLIDNLVYIDDENNIVLGHDLSNYPESIINESDKYGCLWCDSYDDTNVLIRDKIVLSGKINVGSISGCTLLIRNEFKKKYRQFSFTGSKIEEKCIKCDGKGYYEVNMGDIGFSKCICPECNGSGYSAELLACNLAGKTIGDIMNMPLGELYAWLMENGYRSIAPKVASFVNLGLSNISLKSSYTKVSYNQASLMLMAKFMTENEQKLIISNPFKNVSEEEMILLHGVINNECIRLKKKIIIVSEKR